MTGTTGKVGRSISGVCILGFVGLCALLCQSASGQSHAATHQISLSGVSNGGSLDFGRVWGRYATVVTVTNTTGDQADVVAARIATAAQASEAFRKGGGYISATEDELTVRGFPQQGDWILAGTDGGINSVLPPTSFSVRYDAEADLVRLCWANPQAGFSSLVVAKDAQGLALLPGDATSFEYAPVSARLETDLNDSNYTIVGYVDERPSSASGIHLAGEQQDELFCLPFSMGVAPNWSAWSNDLLNANASCFEGMKVGLPVGSFFRTPATKPRYQGLSAAGESYTCGTWRSFLGLTPGRSYRVSLRVNTLGSRVPGSWWFSVHAAHGNLDDAPLTPSQMAGGAPLPDGSQGAEAGRIAEFSSAVTTGSNWVAIGTATEAPGKVVGDIVLPAGVDTITVWTRLRGHDGSPSQAGMDWVAVEQLN